MSKVNEFLSLFEDYQYKTGTKIKLSSDVKADSKEIIPKDSIVKVLKYEVTSGNRILHIESVDGEKATLSFNKGEDIPHKPIK